MTKLCRQYISEIKCFFSICGREERKYLKKLSETVEDFCEEENITSMDELYGSFGVPHDVANTYFSSIDTAGYIKKTHINRWIKCCIAILISVALVGVSIYATYKYKTFKEFEHDSIFLEEIEIHD